MRRQKEEFIMVMNANELKKGAKKCRSQIVLDNVEKIFQEHINYGMKKGWGGVRFRVYNSDTLMGNEEINYLEALGYVVSKLKGDGYDEFDESDEWLRYTVYTINWEEKIKKGEQEKAKKEKIIIKRNKIIISAFFIVAFFIVVSRLYYCYPIMHIAIFLMMLILVIGLMCCYMQVTPQYLYITEKK